MSDFRGSNVSWVEERLVREAPDARRSPPADLRRRVVASLESCEGITQWKAVEWGRIRAITWGGGLAAVVALGAWFVVRVVPPRQGGSVESAAIPLKSLLGDVEQAMPDGVDHILARWEAPLRGEARLIVEDAREFHAYFSSRVPRPRLAQDPSD